MIREFQFEIRIVFIKINRGQIVIWSAFIRHFPLQHNLLQLFWESLIRLPQTAFKEILHRFWERKRRSFRVNILCRQAIRCHKDGHITHHFRRWSYLHNITKQIICFRIIRFQQFKFIAHTQRNRLST